jgi:uncharacterized protein YjbJ (UPF0337 family)
MSAYTDQVKGRIKQSIGALTGNRNLARDGRHDEGAGRTKQQTDHVIDVVRTKFESAAPTSSAHNTEE